MTHHVAYVCPFLLHCSVVSKAKDFLEQKYYSSNVVESCKDIILYTLKNLIIDHTIEFWTMFVRHLMVPIIIIFCTKCIYEIRMHHSYHNILTFIVNDMGHDYICFHTINIYFEERNRKMLPNEFIVYFRELCNCWYYSYCRFLRNDLISYLCLDQND